jgi:lipopolysaccharide/colanic/teichoic acid biosynthesis glycosyltransferase
MPDSNAVGPKKAAYKGWFDLSVLILAHVLLLPLWLALWTIIPVLIWLGDRGPVFYRQQRMGKDGVPFYLLKFRTMIVDADTQGPAWTTDDDSRVTRVGKILRRTALDELPEVISIWQGNMSFVGPRALEVDEHRALEELMPGFEKRLQIRPGLTGLAQIFDKGDDPFEKYRYDMEYLQKLSPFLDARLLLLSVWNTLVAGWDHRSGKVVLENLEPRRIEPIEDSLEIAESTNTEKHL